MISEQEQMQYEMGFHDGYQQALKEMGNDQVPTAAEKPITLSQYGAVICEITNGLLSKLTYDAECIIQTAQERWCDTCDLKENESEDDE